MISNYISSIDRLVRVTMEPVTSVSTSGEASSSSEPSSSTSSLGTIPRFREPGSYGYEFYSQKIRIREGGTPGDRKDQGTPIFSFNDGLRHANQSYLLSTLGQPDGDYASGEEVIINPHAKIRGRVKAFEAAFDDLRVIFDNIDRDYPDLLQYVSYGGMKNLRKIGTTDTWSNHAWGMAIDLGIHREKWYVGTDEDLAEFGRTTDPDENLLEYNGVILMAPYFRELQWYWGGEFASYEDGMHFEVSRSRVETWIRDKRILSD